jgi:hypothetical protein
MKNNIPFVLLLWVGSCVFSQTISFTGPYKYLVGNDNPDAGWDQTEYNDTSWLEGAGGIGYGDIIYAPHYTNTVEGYPYALYNEGDTVIQTLITPATSLYLRYPFTIHSEDTIGISGFSLDAYFDDGFIACLNGVEFARVNLGKKGDTAFFNTLTYRSHESQIAAGDLYPVAGYYINKNFLQEHLVIGENILTVEVHNDSVAGSDLFFQCSLKKCLRDTTYDPLIAFWRDPNDDWTAIIRTKACVEPDSTDLPLILIESDEFGIPFSHVEVPAMMKIIDHAGEQLNHPSDISFTYNGPISIEVRGGSSQYFPKQPFNIETRHADGSNNNVSLLGMPAENDWALIGPISDRSLLRHTFTYELGRKQGHWEPRSKYCELILNGEYLGLYVLTEKIKPDKNRLNISKLTDTDLFEEDVTGGYIFWKSGNWPIIIYYPNSNKIQEEQEAYLEAFVQRYWDVIFSDNWLNGEIDYRDYVNIESMLDYMIICELSCDHDKYSQSTYMYKDRSDKDSLIHFGPLWDFNYAYGNSSESMATDQWHFNRESGAQFRRLFQDTSLTHRFAEKWHSQRQRFLHTDSLFALIDSLSTHFTAARKRDSMVWDAYATVNVYFAKDTVYRYDQVIYNLKEWIQRRVAWIDTWIDSIYFPYTVVEPESIAQYSQGLKLKVYPNPFRNEIKIEPASPFSGSLRLELRNPMGQLVWLWLPGTEWRDRQILTLTIPEGIPPGLYMLNIFQDGQPAGSKCITKTE